MRNLSALVRSGQFSLVPPGVSGWSTTVPQSIGAANPTTYELCRVEHDEPRQVVANIRVRSLDNEQLFSYANTDIHHFAGVPNGAQSRPVSAAGLVFEYGAGSAVRRIVADLRSGSYALPPSQSVKVSLFAHVNDQASSFSPSATVFASLTDEGRFETPTRPIYTAGYLMSGASPRTFSLSTPPAGARWVDFWSTYSAFDANAPVLVLRDVTFNAIPAFRKDYVNATVFPHGGPYELANQRAASAGASLEIRDTGAASGAYVFVRYFLEF